MRGLTVTGRPENNATLECPMLVVNTDQGLQSSLCMMVTKPS